MIANLPTHRVKSYGTQVRGRGIRGRGVALLVVLATLVLVVSAAAALASRASTVKLQRSMDQATRCADELFAGLEPMLVHWLETKSSLVVLSPESEPPQIEVLHERWMANETVYEIRVSAWDVYGRLPIERNNGGSSLRATLPNDVLSRLEKIDVELLRKTPLGLDVFLNANAFDSDVWVFPMPDSSSSPRQYCLDNESRSFDQATSNFTQPMSSSASFAMGNYFTSQQTDPPTINVNTAPMSLVEACLLAAERSGINLILEARQNGDVATTPASSGDQDDRKSKTSHTPRLVSTSEAWSMRIDLAVGQVRRSWWVTYKINDSEWECVQRLVIPE